MYYLTRLIKSSGLIQRKIPYIEEEKEGKEEEEDVQLVERVELFFVFFLSFFLSFRFQLNE